MINPLIYAGVYGVAREPTYGNIGEHKRQAAGKQHAKCSCTCISRTVHRHSFLIHIFLNNYSLVNRAPEAYGSHCVSMCACMCVVLFISRRSRQWL